MFDVDHFIADCRAALSAGSESQVRAAVRELTERAVAEPAAVVAAFGEPRLAGLNTVYRADDLTILNLVWGPGMTLPPHDHRMWATIGIYGGREDNTFYRRHDDGLRRHGTRVLERGEVAALGRDAIHGVHNPLSTLTAALHIYGGDFFAVERSEWDPDTLEEHPLDVETTRAAFAESNRLLEEQRRARAAD